MTYKLTLGWPQDTVSGDFVNPETNEVYQAWLAAGNTPTPYVAPPSAPLTCDAFQIRAALTQQNLRTQVEAAVAASTNQTLKDAWAFSQVFTENDQFVLQMAAALGQTAAQTHALFQLAGTLTP